MKALGIGLLLGHLLYFQIGNALQFSQYNATESETLYTLGLDESSSKQELAEVGQQLDPLPRGDHVSLGIEN